MQPSVRQSAGDGSTGGKAGKIAKRAGIAAFLFFFAKGIVWLVIAFAAVEGCR